MLRQERLKYCKTCQKREFDLNKGILCSITKDYADFEDSCPDYVIDEKIQILESYKSEQEQIEEKKRLLKIEKRKQKKRARKTGRKRTPDKIRLNDLYLVIGSALITVFIIRLSYYFDYSYSDDSGSLYIFLVVYLSSVITLLLRKREEWKVRIFGDFRFIALYSSVLTLIHLLYVLLVHPDNYQIAYTSLAFLVISILLSMFSVIIVIPISLLFRNPRRSNVKPQ